MKVTYDPETDVLRILFKSTAIEESDEDKPGLQQGWTGWTGCLPFPILRILYIPVEGCCVVRTTVIICVPANVDTTPACRQGFILHHRFLPLPVDPGRPQGV